MSKDCIQRLTSLIGRKALRIPTPEERRAIVSRQPHVTLEEANAGMLLVYLEAASRTCFW
jgi:hypothetical protein